MKQEDRRDLNISGFMNGQGGVYRSVTIHGHGKVSGHLDCIDFLCHGKVSVQGGVKAQSAEFHGIVRIAESFEVNRMAVHGKTMIEGNLTGEDVDVHGFLNVNGSCEAESFRARGGFRVRGLLNAGRIDIHLYARCEANEIGGETIRVQKPEAASPFGKLLPRFDVLNAETIEGDEIHLEYTKANIVRGTDVSIGPGCEIGLVEYRRTFQRDDGAKVSESRQI